MGNTDNRKQGIGIFDSLSFPTGMALTYIMLYIPLALATNKEITRDMIAMPAIGIFLVTSLIEYFFIKSKGLLPQWVLVTCYLISVILSVTLLFIV